MFECLALWVGYAVEPILPLGNWMRSEWASVFVRFIVNVVLLYGVQPSNDARSNSYMFELLWRAYNVVLPHAEDIIYMMCSFCTLF